MRAIMVAWLISGCVSHGLVGTRGAAPAVCDAEPQCWPGGSGDAEAIVSASVVGAIAGVIALHVYRRVR